MTKKQEESRQQEVLFPEASKLTKELNPNIQRLIEKTNLELSASVGNPKAEKLIEKRISENKLSPAAEKKNSSTRTIQNKKTVPINPIKKQEVLLAEINPDVHQLIEKTNLGSAKTRNTVQQIKKPIAEDKLLPAAEKKDSLTKTVLTKKLEDPKKQEVLLAESSEMNPNMIRLIEKTNEVLKASAENLNIVIPTEKRSNELSSAVDKSEEEKMEKAVTKEDKTEDKPNYLASETIPRKKQEIISGQQLYEKVKRTPILRTSQSTQNAVKLDAKIKPAASKRSSEPSFCTTKKELLASEIKAEEELVSVEINQKQSDTQTDSSLQIIANAEGKLIITPVTMPSFPETKHPVLDLKSEADLIHINKKAFDELESTLHSVQILVNNATLLRTKSSPSQGYDDSSKKRFSTSRRFNTKQKQELLSKGDNREIIQKTVTKKREMSTSATISTNKRVNRKLKSKTFSKLSSHELEATTSGHEEKLSNKMDRFPLNMRRTTKTAIKKQQVFTVLPKVKTHEDKPTLEGDEMQPMKAVKTEATNAVGKKAKTPRPLQKNFIIFTSKNIVK